MEKSEDGVLHVIIVMVTVTAVLIRCTKSMTMY